MSGLSTVLGLALSLAFIGSSVSEDFCEAFRAHQNSISYIFKQMVRADAPEEERLVHKNHIIINGKYWNLLFDKRTEEFSFNNNESFGAKQFTDKYFEAALLWSGGPTDGSFQTLLFMKGVTDKVYVTGIKDNKFDRARDLDEFEEPEEYSITGAVPDWFGKFAFAHQALTGGYGNVGIDFHIGSGQSFVNKRAGFTPKDKTFTIADRSIEFEPEFQGINQAREVIGVEFQSSKKTDKKGHIILTKKDQVIYWCWRAYDQGSCEEKKGIDCTGPTPDGQPPGLPEKDPQGSKGDPPKEEKSSLLWILIVIAVIVVIIIICVVLFLTCGKKEKDKASAEEGKALPPNEKSVSTRSQDVTSNVNAVKTNRSSIDSKAAQPKSATAASSAKPSAAAPPAQSASGKG